MGARLVCIYFHIIIILTLVAQFFRRKSDDKTRRTTEENPTRGLSGPHDKRGETNDYVQMSSVAL